MSSRYKAVFQEVASDVKKGQFDSAFKRVKDFNAIKNPYLYRARYLVHSNKHSPYYDERISKECLEMLDSTSDVWGQAEKGRCLMLGDFFDQDTRLAEDALTKAGDDSKALYYIAYINDMEMHIDESGEKFGDKAHALDLYQKVIAKGGAYKDLASLAFCKIMISKGDLPLSGKVKVFSALVDLASKSIDDSEKLLARFMLLELADIFSSVYSESKSPSTMLEKIEFESENRDVISALESLNKVIGY